MTPVPRRDEAIGRPGPKVRQASKETKKKRTVLWVSWCEQKWTGPCEQKWNNRLVPLPFDDGLIISVVASAEHRALRGRNPSAA